MRSSLFIILRLDTEEGGSGLDKGRSSNCKLNRLNHYDSFPSPKRTKSDKISVDKVLVHQRRGREVVNVDSLLGSQRRSLSRFPDSKRQDPFLYYLSSVTSIKEVPKDDVDETLSQNLP